MLWFSLILCYLSLCQKDPTMSIGLVYVKFIVCRLCALHALTRVPDPYIGCPHSCACPSPPMHMGFEWAWLRYYWTWIGYYNGWAWARYYCSWVSGLKQSILKGVIEWALKIMLLCEEHIKLTSSSIRFVHPCIQLQIGVKLLGCREYANQETLRAEANGLLFVRSNQDLV